MTLASHLAALVLAASYLLLGVASADTARAWWAPYAVVTLIFAVLNITLERRHVRSPR